GNYQNVALVAGSGCAALSVLTESLPQRRAYDVTIVQWGANHILQPPATGVTFAGPVGEGGPGRAWRPAGVSRSLVAINGNLLRFDGSQWRVTTIGPATTPLMNEAQRYAYGPDYALLVLARYGSVAATVIGFDPDAGAWGTPSAPSLPSSNFAW